MIIREGKIDGGGMLVFPVDKRTALAADLKQGGQFSWT